jgi:hypothetical protein
LVSGVARLFNPFGSSAAAVVGNSFSDGYFVIEGPVLTLAA